MDFLLVCNNICACACVFLYGFVCKEKVLLTKKQCSSVDLWLSVYVIAIVICQYLIHSAPVLGLRALGLFF